MKSAETPLVGPFTLFPRVESPLNRHVFYLFSGLKEQARALVNFLETKRANVWRSFTRKAASPPKFQRRLNNAGKPAAHQSQRSGTRTAS